MSRLKKSSRTDDSHIPGNQEGALRYLLNFSDSLISSQETEADTEEIIRINPKEIIEVNQDIGERNHAKQNSREIVEKSSTGSDHKVRQSERLKNIRKVNYAESSRKKFKAINEKIGITEELTELINQNAELKNQIKKLRKDFELMKSTLEILLRPNNSLSNLETQKLIDETFLKLDKELNNI
ncbi:6352_t:CDS:2 [Racocetra persica]|uniref:6352_t:CDS:1 n=1 Tax=Racocetra persica TaxID=160502 RepID=A0ACA9NT69_9GLOM|nr:6352_t:CDS:2 [Racocetra persica]